MINGVEKNASRIKIEESMCCLVYCGFVQDEDVHLTLEELPRNAFGEWSQGTAQRDTNHKKNISRAIIPIHPLFVLHSVCLRTRIGGGHQDSSLEQCP